MYTTRMRQADQSVYYYATSCTTGETENNPMMWNRFFSLLPSPDWPWGSSHLLTCGYQGDLSPDNSHSPPPSARS